MHVCARTEYLGLNIYLNVKLKFSSFICKFNFFLGPPKQFTIFTIISSIKPNIDQLSLHNINKPYYRVRINKHNIIEFNYCLLVIYLLLYTVQKY